MDRLSELGTARGFAEQRVARAEAELAEAKKDLGRCIGAYIDYVKLNPDPDSCPNDDIRCSCAVGRGHRARLT